MIHGDNLAIMRGLEAGSIDLIYCDPPYNTGRDWLDNEGNVQFCDKWESDVAYYEFCRARIVEVHRLLAPTGSLYWHCDPNTSHYIKIMLDGVFGKKNFRNEIVWSYRRWPVANIDFQRMHDVILRYGIDKPTWNQIYEPLSESTIKRDGWRKGVTTVQNGKRVKLRHLRTETSLGMPLRDVWDLSRLMPAATEHIGYPTQKPLELLERIITVSTNEGDLVLDPFCGSGTTLVAAKRLRRKYIGIDVNAGAIAIAKQRLAAQQEPIL